MKEKILIIEDEKVIRENVAFLLNASGFEVSTAPNGSEGIKHASQFQPDLILCDIMMPEMDGFEVIDQIRQNKALAMVPFIFLTAKSELSDMRKGMILGADDYLTKPFTLEELLGAIEARLRRRIVIDQVVQQRIQHIYNNLNNNSTHEFNTSLNSIMGFTEFLKDHYPTLDESEIQEMFDMVLVSSNRLKRNLESLMMFSEIQALTSSPDTPIPSLGTSTINQNFVQTVWQEVSHSFENVHPAFELHVEEADLPLDARFLKKILVEVFDNAIRYAQSEPVVQVTGRPTLAGYLLSIQDNGQGFEEEELSKILPFHQFERVVQEKQGLGLGLYLSRLLIESIGGSLVISGKTDGETQVQLSFPRTS
ncbi:hybrid sensor histidine kinase/response regulator [Arundinibacter roseus]|uniref:histidine kinase n=1 Tax=Arundinibacter roseus TaxID=2070510 RepID=A0A4R4KRZ4_9BACT|nr:response regulator [Arundinibacter roseus]TDB69201.1 response regulator [Arundinibacter roseus]